MTVRTARRREAILEAALECFSAAGYEGASIDRICRRSGASVGSVYHHFGDKEGVAAALYVEGILRYQDGILEILDTDPDAPQGTSAIVAHHVAWIERHPDWARFLFGAAPPGAVDRESIRDANARLLARLGTWIERHDSAGSLVAMRPGVFLAVVLGPVHELARRRLGGRSTVDLSELAPELSAAACRAVGASNPGG